MVVWVGLTMIMFIPLSVRFCQGKWGFDRTGWVTGQDGGTSQININPTHVPDHDGHRL